MGARSPSHWTTREVPQAPFLASFTAKLLERVFYPSDLHFLTSRFSPPPTPSQPPSSPLPKTAVARSPVTPHCQIQWSLLSPHPVGHPEALKDSHSPSQKSHPRTLGFLDAPSDLAASSHLLSPISEAGAQTVPGSAPLLHLFIPKFTSSSIALNTIKMLMILNHQVSPILTCTYCYTLTSLTLGFM